MKVLDIVRSANRNLLRSRLRTLLTILAIFVGGFVLTLTTALNTGTGQYLDRQLGNVSVPGVFEVFPKTDLNPFGSGEVREYDPQQKTSSFEAAFTASMNQEDVDKLQAVEGVESAIPYYSLSAEYIQHGTSKKYALPQVMQHFGLNLDLASGRLPTAQDKNAIILPEDYLEPFGFTPDSALNQQVTIAYRDQTGQVVERTLTVIGVMRKSFVTSGQIFVDINSARTLAEDQGQAGRFLAIMVTFKDANEQTDEAILKERLQNAGNYTAASIQERVGTVLTIVDAITASLNVVGIIALLAASFGIINTLLMSVYERTKEVGLMKALGMSRRFVFSLFAFEAMLVGFWGSIVAVAVAAGVAQLVNNFASQTFLKDFDGFTLLVITPVNVLIVMLLIMGIAFLAGTLPAIKASRLNPIDALRSE
jgi:putative ABC transport system permease protein